MSRTKCDCPLYCLYCGRRRSRDAVGHYCKSPNCQWQHGYSTCTLHKERTKPQPPHPSDVLAGMGEGEKA